MCPDMPAQGYRYRGEEIVKELNILIVGVGGQGVILLSELLGKVAVGEGLNVRGSEVLGMAVRGGSVVSTIRIGSEVYGPLIPMGKGNILVGMEPAEALRHVTYLAPSGIILLNTRKVVPFTATLGEREYPELDIIIKRLEEIARVVTLDASRLAEEAGSPLAANIVMLGALFATGEVPMAPEKMKQALQAHFPTRIVRANLKAFDIGYQECQNICRKTVRK